MMLFVFVVVVVVVVFSFSLFLNSSAATLADVLQDIRLTFLRTATQRQSRKTMTSVSAGHIILTPTQTSREWVPEARNPRPPHQQSRALPSELPPKHHGAW